MTGHVVKTDDDGFVVELWEGDRKVSLYSDGHILYVSEEGITDKEDASAKDMAEALRWLLEPSRERNKP
jgi:hypothetical protein